MIDWAYTEAKALAAWTHRERSPNLTPELSPEPESRHTWEHRATAPKDSVAELGAVQPELGHFRADTETFPDHTGQMSREAKSGPRLCVAWKQDMYKCVDAVPLVVCLSRRVPSTHTSENNIAMGMREATRGGAHACVHDFARMTAPGKSSAHDNAEHIDSHGGVDDCSPFESREGSRDYFNAVIVGSHAHQLACFDLESGSEIWRVRLHGRIEVRVHPCVCVCVCVCVCMACAST